MKKVLITLLALAFVVSTPCWSAAEGETEEALSARAPAADSHPEASEAEPWTPAEAATIAFDDGDVTTTVTSTCTAEAMCENGSTRSCAGESTCIAVDASCPAQRGYVKCDGSYTFCPPCEDCNARACIQQCGPPNGGYCQNGVGCICF